MQPTSVEPDLIVGIGTSAGGLAVLKQFFNGLPTTTGMAFVIVQHLDPNHESMLAHILAKNNELKVKDAINDGLVEVDCVYVIPPNTSLELENDRLKVLARDSVLGSRNVIDQFLKSLARERGDSCAGIILSGAGNDGVAGMRAINAAGGMTLVQRPQDAEHSAMPESVIAADACDRVIGVDDMYRVLVQYGRHPIYAEVEQQGENEDPNATTNTIAELIKEEAGFNIAHYKPTTVRRRIARRMSLTDIPNYQNYLELLRSSADERKKLADDLLISVTDFFRDKKAFATLAETAIPDIIKSFTGPEEIRIWIAGCATGEEAYTTAILFTEALSNCSLKHTLKIFATDIDEHAIKIARKGIYSDQIAERLPPQLLQKYFQLTESDGLYKVSALIRDVISFAIQNVAQDPPFNHIHLVSCRNLLIYLTKNVQKKVLASFCFALQENGYLFLGSSESLGNYADAFATKSAKWRIFQKLAIGKSNSRLDWPKSQYAPSARTLDAGVAQASKSSQRITDIQLALVDTLVPATVIVDEDGQVLYLHGNLKPYLSLPEGEPRNDISALLPAELRSRVRSSIFKVKKSQQPVSFHCSRESERVDKTEATSGRGLVIQINPVAKPKFSDKPCFSISFLPNEPIKAVAPLSRDDERRAVDELERELAETREELRNTIEELETSSEELKASHEEALSTNEELQSANEEMEASSEELRSLNEELSTVNAQLKDNLEELNQAQQDLQNFFTSTNLPTLFLDTEFNIKRFTPAAEQLLKLGLKDIGRPVKTLGGELLNQNLLAESTQVLQNFQPLVSEITDIEGRWYSRQITPYRTETRQIIGVVITFQDITELKHLSQRAELRERQQATVSELGMLALSGIDPQELIERSVRQVAHILNVDYCAVWHYQPVQENFVMVSGCGWQEHSLGKLPLAATSGSLLGFTLQSQEPVVVEEIQSEKRFSLPELIMQSGVTSCVSCLINHDEPPYGVLVTGSRQQQRFISEDVHFLHSICHMLSTAVGAKNAKDKILRGEQRLQFVLDANNMGEWELDLATGLASRSPQHDRIFGYPQMLPAWSYDDFMHHIVESDRERVNFLFQEALTTGNWSFDCRIQTHQGEMRWIWATGVISYDKNNQPTKMSGLVTDITEQRKIQESYREYAEKLSLAVSTNKIGAFEYNIIDASLRWDTLLNQLWGVDPDAPLFMEQFWAGVHPEDHASVEAALQASMQPNGTKRYEAFYRVINAQTQAISWVHATGQTLFEQGNAYRMIGMVIDITEQKQSEAQLVLAIESLQDMDKKKNEFLSILGHELRNPLAALSGAINVMQIAPERIQTTLEVMQHSVATMSRLLDDLLDINRVSQNKIDLNLQLVEVKPLLRDVYNMSVNFCDRKRQTLTWSAEDNLWLLADALRLEQVFSNLIVNASKFTPEGGCISLHAGRFNDDIIFTVSDNGVGMSAEVIDKIFDAFYQVKKQGEVMQGLGLGLALCKNLIEMHKGSITVRSDGDGFGSCFTVTLPAQNLVNSTGQTKPAEQQNFIQPGLKVAVVDDNQDITDTLPLLLSALGCSVETANNGTQGVELISHFEPQAGLIDIGLPDLTGYQVAEKLRSDGFRGLLIAVSGYSHAEAREQSLAAGFDHHIAKPANIEEITSLLSRLTVD